MTMLTRSYVMLPVLASASTMSWTAQAGVGPHVSGHATAVDASGRVFSFGGLTGSAGSPCENKLSCFGGDNKWEVLPTKNGPGPRMYAAAACLGDHFYLLGGWDPEAPGSGGSFKNEAWRLGLSSLEWEQIASMPCGPVSRHVACTVGSQVIVHTFRGVLVLDEPSGTLRQVQTTGDDPGALSMSAACALDGETMLLFGGSTKTQQMTADVWLLDTKTWTWKQLQVRGDQGPSPRASSCAAAAPDGKSAVIFGGAGIGSGGYEGGAGLTAYSETWRVFVDGMTAKWVKLDAHQAPHARVAASLDTLPSGAFLLQGGWDPKSKDTYDAPYILSLG